MSIFTCLNRCTQEQLKVEAETLACDRMLGVLIKASAV
jgi:hypothetical protein